MMPANAALFYHPEGFNTATSKLMGRQAAGEGFLRGWVRHAGVERLFCHADNEQIARHFDGSVRANGWTGPVGWVPTQNPAGLVQPGALFVPGPTLAPYAWARRGAGISGHRAYSIVGVTHTTASATAMDGLADLLTTPTYPWDAVICTSHAVRAMVTDLLDSHADFLRQRFGLPPKVRLTRPHLPVIPLGVDCDSFASSPAARTHWRTQLGIAPQDVMVLFMGRLSFHAKAHPVVMYKALQEAAGHVPDGGRLHLVEAGWFANDFIKDAYATEAGVHAPDIMRHVLDGRLPDVRAGIWHAADIFCSMSDNIQETFGLTPIEAMAAGLPCIVSDWDGYKETVRQGQDGFRIETWMPPAPLGMDMARRHATGIDSYDQYCGQTCQFVAVDVPQAVSAMIRLVADPELRCRMGQSGRMRARTSFDWKVVISQYQALFSELADIREHAQRDNMHAAPVPDGHSAWPQRSDPFRAFANYPTFLIGHDCLVQALRSTDRTILERLYQAPSVRYAANALPALPLVEHLLSVLSTRADQLTTVAELLMNVPEQQQAIALRGLVWLAKYDIVRLMPAPLGN